MKNSFDTLAGWYDLIARAAFGKKWRAVQESPCRNLAEKREVLIVGGGTGQLLQHLGGDHCITFVELSSEMIRKAQARKVCSPVDFIHADYRHWQTGKRFDAILFPFFLDCFRRETLPLILAKAQNQLDQHGELHVVDFQKAGKYRNFLVRLMYLAFGVITNLEGNTLPDLDQEIVAAGFSRRSEVTYFGGWVFYRVYERG